MPERSVFTATYAIESEIDPEQAAGILAGEQSSGTFVRVPGEGDRLREEHGATVSAVRPLGEVAPSLPSRAAPRRVHAAEVDVEFPLANVHHDLATLFTVVGGNLFELQELYACRLVGLRLPDEFVGAFSGPAFGVAGTRRKIGRAVGALVGTIVKPNVGLDEEGFRAAIRSLAGASIDLIKDDELMTDPAYLPLETRVRIVREELADAADATGHQTMYAFNITGDLAGLRRRYELVADAGGTCVMLTVPAMGLPALQWLCSFGELPVHAHRAGLAASMRHPALGISYQAWQLMARLAGADHIHVSGLGGKFYERDEEVVANVRALREPLGDTLAPLPTLSSAQTVYSPGPTYAALGTTDVLMLAGGGISAHPDGAEAGVRSLRQAWDAAVDGVGVEEAASVLARSGDTALQSAVRQFGARRTA